MYNLNQHIHFIGIGGVGMAGIAEVLKSLGYTVSGSDAKENLLTAELRQLGVRVCIGHREENLADDTSVVVVSTAIPPHNPELVAAKARGLPVIPRAEMLAELMRMKYGIAVAGAHGKTTTTSMTAKVLRDVGLDPTVIVGGRVLTQATGARLGTGQYVVAEADESDGSFNLLRPAIAVITNIDQEHMSHWGSSEALDSAFRSFAESVPFYGPVIACAEDSRTMRVLEGLSRRVITYGFSEHHTLSAHELSFVGPISSYTLKIGTESVGRVRLPASGAHMVLNSLAAIAVALELGAYPEEATASLATFPGVSRRTELIGEEQGVLVLDDYGHHPNEIAATLAAIRTGWLPYQAERSNGGKLGRLHVVFEPHRYSRTQELFSEFCTAFRDADELYVGEIYPAGEEPLPDVSGERLAAAICSPRAAFVPNLENVVDALARVVVPGDIVVTLGAGTVGSVAKLLVDHLAHAQYPLEQRA
ncbi:MAG: UDP-N-acetylmuramate--L-alanine ligase [Bdellovibrionales bacterium]|nr:UDP-N-acetylmuramate--L-alanine ligase [Bdellovibrionales bacterium]